MKLTGSIKPVCPHCGVLLSKMPHRRTKCPHCGEFIFVRTRPADEQRVLVTASEAEEIETQWNCTIEMRPQIMQRDDEVLAAAREDLRKKFRRLPSEYDVLWKVFNEELVRHSTRGMWGLYTQVLFEMGELLMSEGRVADALCRYLDAFYIQTNGPRNIESSHVDADFPVFKPGGRVPEQYINRIVKMMGSCELAPEKLESLFLQRAQELHRELQLPVPPQVALDALAVYLQ